MKKETEGMTIQVRDDLYEIRSHGSLDYPVGVYRVELKRMYLGLIRWHWHDELELMIVYKGRACFSALDTSFVLEKGQGILINRNTMHAVHPYEEEDCFYYSIVFHPSFLFGYGRSQLSSAYLLPVANHPDLRYKVLDSSEEDGRRILDFTDQLIKANEDKSFGYELETKRLLLQIWLVLLDTMRALPQNPEIKSDAQLGLDELRTKEALTYISAHYSEPITLQDIADSIHLSKSECCRCFKRCLQLTPFEYLLKYRVYSAVTMLVQNVDHLSISEIALRVGFNSSSYFNKLFKKYIGCTPSDYKKALADGGRNLPAFLGEDLASKDRLYYENLIRESLGNENGTVTVQT